MTNVVIPLTNYKDRFGGYVPPGRYRVKVEDAEPSTASTGSQGFEVWFTVLDGEHAGSTLTDRLYYKGPDGSPSKALFRVVNFLQSLGVKTPKRDLSLNLDSLRGKVLNVDVVDDEYQGRTRSSVAGYERVRGGSSQQSADIEDIPEADDSATTATTADDGDVDLETLDLG